MLGEKSVSQTQGAWLWGKRLRMLWQSWAPHGALAAAGRAGARAASGTGGSQISYRGAALQGAGSPWPSPAPLVSPGPQAGSEPGSPGTPGGIASCLQAAPEGQPGLGSAVSQPLRLPLIHFTLSILIGSALSPAPPPSHALPPAGCCTTGQPGLHAA